MSKSPKLSIVTISYNQEKFIKQTLQSFIDQKVNFDLEIIVADDASSDNTQKIIRDYEKNYPGKFVTILRKKNVGAWNNFTEALKMATGDYIALCEGDDYWTDPSKLQRQVDFLDRNKDHSICFHPVRVVFENGEQEDSIYPPDAKSFTLDRLLQGNFIQTNSVVYRRQDYRNIADNVIPGDWYLHLYHAQFGKIGFINRVMSVYRRHTAGMWWDSVSNADKFWERHSLAHFSLCNEILKMYGKDKEHEHAIESTITYVCNRTVDYDSRKHTALAVKAMNLYPHIFEMYITAQRRLVNQKNEEVLRHVAINETLKKELNGLINEYEHQLSTIRMSRSFRLGDALIHPSKLPGLITGMVRR